MGTFGTQNFNITQNFGYYVLLTELPSYMKNVLNYDLKSKVSPSSDPGHDDGHDGACVQGFLSGVPYLAMWLVSAGGSILVDFIISKQIVSTTVIRKIANTIATLGPALALLGANMSKILKNLKYCLVLLSI